MNRTRLVRSGAALVGALALAVPAAAGAAADPLPWQQHSHHAAPSPGRPTAHATAPSAKTQKQLEQIFATRDIPGAQVVHLKDGHTETYHVGVQSKATGVAVTDRTLFQAASLTKVVTAYTALRYVDRGQLSLDKPLYSYYASPRIAPGSAGTKVTARMVLDHTTGFPNWAGSAGDDTTALTTAFTPGSQFSYSGEGFYLLQQTLEHLTGKDFETLVEKEVFRPFGMPESTLVTRPGDAAITAVGHDSDGNPDSISQFTHPVGAYTLLTTATEYMEFVNKAVLHGTGLSRSTYRAWLAPQSDADWTGSPSAADPFVSWGLGIGLQRNERGQSAWHWGDNGDLMSFFLADPGTDEAVAIFTNSANGFSAYDDVLPLFYGKQSLPVITWLVDYYDYDRH